MINERKINIDSIQNYNQTISKSDSFNGGYIRPIIYLHVSVAKLRVLEMKKERFFIGNSIRKIE